MHVESWMPSVKSHFLRGDFFGTFIFMLLVYEMTAQLYFYFFFSLVLWQFYIDKVHTSTEELIVLTFLSDKNI